MDLINQKLLRKKLLSIFLIGCIVLGFFTYQITISSEATKPVNGLDLVIKSQYTVTGKEIWNNVTIKGTGKLIIPKKSTLNAQNIFLENGSIIEISGGKIILNTTIPTVDLSFNGTCDYFNITNYGLIKINGGKGWANTTKGGPYNDSLSTSKGGDATFNITINKSIKIDNSTIRIIGGNGFNLPPSTNFTCNAWTNGTDLGDYVAAGGNATIYFNFKPSESEINIKNSKLITQGGNGGKAADGGNGANNKGGEGGGYSGGGGSNTVNSTGESGGNVSGFVGSGGRAKIVFNSYSNITILNSNLSSTGGKGGNGGRGGMAGGSSFNSSGGGGGGYGGGGGGGNLRSGGGDSGNVSGFVGSGGNSTILIKMNSIFTLINSTLWSSAGAGGRAGNGGNGTSGGLSGPASGSGGGGYGGGGGPAWNGKGGEGKVYDNVGSGGIAAITILGDICDISNSIIYSRAGSGGNAGNGGPGLGCPSGGGGYGGGGASETQTTDFGNGSAHGNVGTGGNSFTIFLINRSKLTNTNIIIKGGNGGKAGNGGVRTGAGGGSGGGGYGGGGGGRNSYGGNGIVSGNVGSGGEALFNVTGIYFAFIDSNLTVFGGDGGDGGKGGTYNSGAGGAGGGGYAGAGGGGGTAYIGGMGFVTGSVGDGGNASISFNIKYPSISVSSRISISEGLGGSGSTSKGGDKGDGSGGAGTGRTTSNGKKSLDIPMSVPSLLFPQNNSYIYSNPKYQWAPLHKSTKNGLVIHYIIQISSEYNFTSLIYSNKTTQSWDNPPITYNISKKYYWRVIANYSTPPNANLGWSEISSFELPDFPWVVDIKRSPNKVYRNRTIRFYINGSDIKDNESDLICKFQYKAPFGNWTNITDIKYNGTSPSGFWYTYFKPKIDVEIGIYQFRCRFIDTENNTGNWIYDFFRVKNSKPKILDITYSSVEINRTETLVIFINASDTETSERLLNFSVQYRAPLDDWMEITKFEYKNSKWIAYWKIPLNFKLGYYDLRYKFDDLNNDSSGWFFHFDKINISNNLPRVIEIKYSGLEVFRKSSIILYINGSDIEDTEDNLTCYIQYRSPISTWKDISNSKFVIDHWEVIFTPKSYEEPGFYDFRVNLCDTDGDYCSWYEDFDVILVKNNIPITSMINYSKKVVKRTDSIYILADGADIETPDIQIRCDIQYRSPNGVWINLTNEKHVEGTWLVEFNPAKDFDLGTYDFRVRFADIEGNHSNWLESYDQVLVLNNNPKIITKDFKKVYEDDFYYNSYKASDIETPDLIWTFDTNASWLNWGHHNQTLYGTPTNDDIGKYWIRINISDDDGGFDEHYFILTVINTNDPPIISGAPTNFEVPALEDVIIDIEPFIIDIDHPISNLILYAISEYSKIDGLKIILNYPNSEFTENISVFVSDGIDSSDPHYILITVIPKDFDRPSILKVSPRGWNVPINTNISINFNEPMNRTTCEKGFLISPLVNGKFIWINNSSIFIPSINLSYNTTYEITMTIKAEDLAGNTILRNYEWNFTTELRSSIITDTDKDGYPDEIDAFPFNPLEWLDTDDDKTGNNADTDDDNDGLLDIDEFSLGTDPLLWDTDGDGYNDKDDGYPLDPEKWEKEDSKKKAKDSNSIWLLSIGTIICILVIIFIFLLFFKKGKKGIKGIEEKSDENKKETQLSQLNMEGKQIQISKSIEQKYCQSCGQSLKYFSQNNKYYCSYCKKYD